MTSRWLQDAFLLLKASSGSRKITPRWLQEAFLALWPPPRAAEHRLRWPKSFGNMCQKSLSCVFALLEYVLKIFCFARSLLIVPELFQERPMTLPRGLKTAPGSSKTAPRSFQEASLVLQPPSRVA